MAHNKHAEAYEEGEFVFMSRFTMYNTAPTLQNAEHT